jgi:hypothetical protein
MFMRFFLAGNSRGVPTVPVVPAAPGLPVVPIWDLVLDGIDLVAENFDPALASDQRVDFSVYRPVAGSIGQPRGQVQATPVNDAQADPFLLVADYTVQNAVELHMRAFVVFRFGDEFGRISNVQVKSLAYDVP